MNMKLKMVFLEQQLNNVQMEASRVPALQKQCSTLQTKNNLISTEIEQMRLNYYKDLQVFKVHDHQRRKEEN